MLHGFGQGHRPPPRPTFGEPLLSQGESQVSLNRRRLFVLAAGIVGQPTLENAGAAVQAYRIDRTVFESRNAREKVKSSRDRRPVLRLEWDSEALVQQGGSRRQIAVFHQKSRQVLLNDCHAPG